MQEMDEFRIHLQGWFATCKNDEAAIAALLQARSQDVLALISLYPLKSVSQKGHFRLQPLIRTNTAGLPDHLPSP